MFASFGTVPDLFLPRETSILVGKPSPLESIAGRSWAPLKFGHKKINQKCADSSCTRYLRLLEINDRANQIEVAYLLMNFIEQNTAIPAHE